MAYYVVGPDGKETGPVGLDELVSWVRAGQLPRSAPVRDEGSSRTVQAGQMIELASYFPPAPAGSGGNAVIPTGNPDALWGYYLGWLSLLCLIGLLFAPFSVMKSLRGLKKYKADPSVYGKAHAIVGLTLAGLGTLANLWLVLLFFSQLAP